MFCVKCLITTDYEIIGDIVTGNLNYKLEYSHNIYFFHLRTAKLAGRMVRLTRTQIIFFIKHSSGSFCP